MLIKPQIVFGLLRIIKSRVLPIYLHKGGLAELGGIHRRFMVIGSLWIGNSWLNAGHSRGKAIRQNNGYNLVLGNKGGGLER
jgi:hypothetical protein